MEVDPSTAQVQAKLSKVSLGSPVPSLPDPSWTHNHVPGPTRVLRWLSKKKGPRVGGPQCEVGALLLSYAYHAKVRGGSRTRVPYMSEIVDDEGAEHKWLSS